MSRGNKSSTPALIGKKTERMQHLLATMTTAVLALFWIFVVFTK